jgi:hypothetical protein
MGLPKPRAAHASDADRVVPAWLIDGRWLCGLELIWPF